jgi:hypothetical protein
MPGAPLYRDELHQLAVSANEVVRRYPERAKLEERRVRRRVEAVGEQTLDRVPAIAARRQADGVQHHEADPGKRRTLVAIRRNDPPVRPARHR